MQIFRNLKEAQVDEPTVLTIGTFDGLHLGHRHLMDQLKTAAQHHQAQSAVISFHPRPKAVLAPHLSANDYLSTDRERIALFETLGIDILVLMPFSLELAQTRAHDFMKLLVNRLNIVELWAGHDFALGKNREGNIKKLTVLGQEFNYTIQEFDPFFIEGQIVSSTRVRQAIIAGEVREAAHLLGRTFSLTSEIVQGNQRGRTIGFPTANFKVPVERLLPTNGVYATFITRHLTQQRYPSVTNVGVRPSFGGQTPSVESYIFDFDTDIYGETLTVEFVERLRPEKKFESIEGLVAQIKADADQAKLLLAEESRLAQ